MQLYHARTIFYFECLESLDYKNAPGDWLQVAKEIAADNTTLKDLKDIGPEMSEDTATAILKEAYAQFQNNNTNKTKWTKADRERIYGSSCKLWMNGCKTLWSLWVLLVMAIQAKLKFNNIQPFSKDIVVDGMYGPATKLWVQMFQDGKYGHDGLAGMETIHALLMENSIPASAPTLPHTDSTSDKNLEKFPKTLYTFDGVIDWSRQYYRFDKQEDGSIKKHYFWYFGDTEKDKLLLMDHYSKELAPGVVRLLDKIKSEKNLDVIFGMLSSQVFEIGNETAFWTIDHFKDGKWYLKREWMFENDWHLLHGSHSDLRYYEEWSYNKSQLLNWIIVDKKNHTKFVGSFIGFDNREWSFYKNIIDDYRGWWHGIHGKWKFIDNGDDTDTKNWRTLLEVSVWDSERNEYKLVTLDKPISEDDLITWNYGNNENHKVRTTDGKYIDLPWFSWK